MDAWLDVWCRLLFYFYFILSIYLYYSWTGSPRDCAPSPPCYDTEVPLLIVTARLVLLRYIKRKKPTRPMLLPYIKRERHLKWYPWNYDVAFHDIARWAFAFSIHNDFSLISMFCLKSDYNDDLDENDRTSEWSVYLWFHSVILYQKKYILMVECYVC